MALTEYASGLVHEPTQTAGPGLDLTVNAVERVVEPGRVDFGGEELEPARTELVETERRSPDDDYGWWDLTEGVYLVEFNEALTVPDGTRVVLQTRDAVRASGGFHPTLHLSGSDPLEEVPFLVGDRGLRVKENARLSTLLAE